MKTKFWLFMMLLACSLVSFSGCSSSEPTVKSKRTKVEKSEPEKLALQKPFLRGFGIGTGFTESIARNQAELAARTAWGRYIESKVESSVNNSDLSRTLASSDVQSAGSMTDTEIKASGMAKMVSSNIVNKTAIIDSETYQLENGTYQCYVCVEYQEGESALMRDINNTISKAVSPVKAKLNDAQRKQIDDDMAELQKQLEKDLMNY